MSKELYAVELAEMLGGTLVGSTSVCVRGVASLEDAEPGHLSFLANKKYHGQVLPSQAGIVLVPEDFEPAPPEGRAWVVCANTNEAFQRIVMHFAPPAVEYSAGIHPTAVVEESAQVAESAHVGPNAVVCANAIVGDGSVIGAGSYVGHGTRIGGDCLIYPNVTIRERCLLGNRVIIHSGTTIGSDGYAYVFGPTGHQKIPQVGIVQIDDDVEIGACAAVDRARFGRTWIQQGTKIDNLVQIAHNVVIGQCCLVIAQVGVAGSSRLGNGVVLGGQSGVTGHVRVGDGVMVAGQSAVARDVKPGIKLMGSPASEVRVHMRQQSQVRNLGRLKDTVKDLQKKLDELQARIDG